MGRSNLIYGDHAPNNVAKAYSNVVNAIGTFDEQKSANQHHHK